MKPELHNLSNYEDPEVIVELPGGFEIRLDTEDEIIVKVRCAGCSELVQLAGIDIDDLVEMIATKDKIAEAELDAGPECNPENPFPAKWEIEREEV